mgnify:CR=1 FL=1
MPGNTTPSRINVEELDNTPTDIDNTPTDIDGFINVTPKQYRYFNLLGFINVSPDIKNEIVKFIRNKITVESKTLTDAQKKTHLEQYKGENLKYLFDQEGGSLRLRKKPKPCYTPLTVGGKKSRKNRRKTKKRRKSKRRRRKGKKSVKSRRK